MERKYESAEEALAVAKEAVWLAWVACGGTSGYGFMRDKPDADKEAVWKNATSMGDYPGARVEHDRINADYVFGRMMKLRFNISGNSLGVPDHEPRGDYQSWCYKYKTYASLFDAAEKVALPSKAAA